MAAPFDWWEAYRSPTQTATWTDKRKTMIRGELEERAALLRRLGYSSDQAKLRLRAHLAWEYERNQPAPFLDEIDTLVDAVWRRGSPPSGPLTL
ncbi:MAG TPA: hypothetical protein VH877_15110 [Polyangia bacterium]|jgi:hypothetical protein|nr:hypothetical protein [Polyangia bacterium]